MKRVLFIGPVGEFKVQDGGYGTAASGIYYILEKMKEDGVITLDLFSTLEFNKFAIKEKEKYDVSITVSHPSSFKQVNLKAYFEKIYKNCNKNYLSVVWETNKFPKDWDWLWVNNLFDGFLAPSFFILNMLKQITQKPIFYYPHFLNKDLFPQIDIQEKINEKIFTVLFIGQNTIRKGLEDAVISYIRALGNNKNCRLFLKYHNLSNKELPVEEMIKYTYQCNASTFKINSIFSIESFLTQQEISKLYRNSSVLLMSSRGEGFGLPIGEAMLTGIPVIYTNWSSMVEVGEGNGNYPTEYILDEAVGMSHYGYDNFNSYAIPLKTSLMNNLQKAFNLWTKSKEEYYMSVRENRNIIDKKYGIEAIKLNLINIINGKCS